MTAVAPLQQIPPSAGNAGLEALKRFILEAWKEHEQASFRSAETARRMGVYLLEVKLALGHGHFLDWIKREMPFGPSKAEYCMKIASRFRDPAEFAKIANLKVTEVLRLVAEEAEEEEEEEAARDDRTREMFDEQAAPTPTDAASRVRAAGMVISGETEHGRTFRLLIQRLAREKLRERFAPEALVAELDSATIKALMEGAPAWIEWFGQLLGAAEAQRAARNRLNTDARPRLVS